MKRAYHYLQQTKSVGLVYTSLMPGVDIEKLRLHGYVDADWGGDKVRRRSTSGYCIFLAGACIIWASRRQVSTAGSSTEAEWIASALAVHELLWIRHILYELEYFLDDAHLPPKAPKLQDPNTYVHPAADEVPPAYDINRPPFPPTPLYVDNMGACINSKNPEHRNK
ncbi:MAG: Ty1/Copia family ribonuclease HI, partial [Paenibacillus sp.]|uniref:Ty1/Copia family ribonuclease HI n=1 Tax=Paenibacillus sp. TaxID=58172 RepID=UPI003B7EF36B